MNHPTTKINIFRYSLAQFTKKHYLCSRKVDGILWAERQNPYARNSSTHFADIIKRRLSAFVLVLRNPENFTDPEQDAIDVLVVCTQTCVLRSTDTYGRGHCCLFLLEGSFRNLVVKNKQRHGSTLFIYSY